VTQVTRKYDNIYDPVFYSSSGATAHIKRYNAAMAVQRVANYENMFSDVRPAHGYAFKTPKHVPDSPLPPSGTHKSLDITAHQSPQGRDLAKFIKRPNVPYVHHAQTSAMMAAQTIRNNQPVSKKRIPSKIIEVSTPRVKTVGVQTLYRDSETQTDPYTPDYILPEGEEPEVLSISQFSHANGMLPVSMHEVNIIKRMREKQDYLENLPEITDEKSMELRKRMLAAQEKKEWKYREDQMKEEQNAKLQQLMDKLRARDDAAQAYLNRRLEKLKQAKLGARNDSLASFHRKRVKGFRQIGKEAKSKPKKTKRDFISEYADFESQVYVPITRIGRMPAKNQVVDYGIPLIQDFQGLSALEQSVSGKIKPKNLKPADEILKRRDKITKGHLDHVDQIVNGKDSGVSGQSIENMYKNIQPNVRPSTPEIAAEEDSGIYEAAVLLQKLIRGRAVQNEMYEQKARCLPLIKELQIDEKDAPGSEGSGDITNVDILSSGTDLLSGMFIAQTLSNVGGYAEELAEYERKQALLKKERKRKKEERARQKALEAKKRLQEEEERKQKAAERLSQIPSEVSEPSKNVLTFAKNVAVVEKAIDDGSISKEADEDKDREIVTKLVNEHILPEVIKQRKNDLAVNAD